MPGETGQCSDHRRGRDQKLAAIICARNEEKTVGTVVTEVRPFVDEVLVMDGHSTDATFEVSRRAGAVVQLDPGAGKGSAIRDGLRRTNADIVVLIDADGSHDASDIPLLVQPVLAGEADLCVGSRFSGGSEELSVDFPQLVRTIGNISMNVAINWRWNTRLTDTLNGFRAVRRDLAIAARLVEDRHTIEQEMVMRMLQMGCRVTNRPTHEAARLHGESHIRIWREWPRFVWCVAKNIVR